VNYGRGSGVVPYQCTKTSNIPLGGWQLKFELNARCCPKNAIIHAILGWRESVAQMPTPHAHVSSHKTRNLSSHILTPLTSYYALQASNHLRKCNRMRQSICQLNQCKRAKITEGLSFQNVPCSYWTESSPAGILLVIRC
jgi:hypothetical protein